MFPLLACNSLHAICIAILRDEHVGKVAALSRRTSNRVFGRIYLPNSSPLFRFVVSFRY